ncbi:MAG: hypothetical protein ACKVZJ_10600, partial [Phycisphaerales bacterium]
MPSLAIACDPCESAAAASGGAVAVRGAVTVFVTTVGAPSSAACRDRLAAQDCPFALQVSDHVTPVHGAALRRGSAPVGPPGARRRRPR